MPPSVVPGLNFRDFHLLAPHTILALWGLVVVMVDVTILRGQGDDERRLATGRLALLGTLGALAASFVPLVIRFDLLGLARHINMAGIDYATQADPYFFFGTLADDLLTQSFNVILLAMLVLVVGLSLTWSFTESWGEYHALLLWSTVGMMLLTASEELLTLFLSLEMMTVCLYLLTAFEKQKRRSVEAGFKYFVYGSVSSALFLFGLSLVYGLTGTTRFVAIHQALSPFPGQESGLSGNLAGMTAVLLVLVGFGFKVASVPFHQWAPDAYEGAPAPVSAWIATGSKVASVVAMMKVLLHALGPWASPAASVVRPGWIGVVVVLAAASMTYGNFAALAQRNLKRLLAYSSIAHGGYLLVGIAAAGLSTHRQESAGSVLYYLVIYAASTLGAFAVAAWLARDKQGEDVEDLNGLASQYPGLATCILILMLSLIGIPPMAGFFGKLYMFMEALNQDGGQAVRLAFIWLVGLGLLNSVVSAFYYVRILRAMFLRPPGAVSFAPPSAGIALPIVLGAAIVIGFGILPGPLVNLMKGAAVPMLSSVEAPIEPVGPTTAPPR
ncbi:NADH-quinone oxidoreductase subunit N [Singulisphaera sp. PoT]|uniref:NADH-quinone oxidoreductase subunit N n=1 Tax=Singulisphaera sp. PoT TaxID=3411797 RepID=UPI003BF587B4